MHKFNTEYVSGSPIARSLLGLTGSQLWRSPIPLGVELLNG